MMTSVRRSARLSSSHMLGSVFINTTIRARVLNPFTGRMVYADGKTGKYVQACLEQPETRTPKVKRYALNRSGKVIRTRPRMFNRFTGRWVYVDTKKGEQLLSLSCLMVLGHNTILNVDVCSKIACFL